ncbi:hypothetical protein THAOC_09251 [Thalassiosira oceanica]|uniref:Uncharacterized protein n=1 Tax=Thalassiosira oceanica TaxID=159749 RepID=K0T7Z7_THAOC|nr:hypothetical protein THAOC_09251 [Thalassiosira oceanica]|eukprot:EJK69486.1 hypothetical protein THAOC_09251 [Thalassiosira oceanica]
MDPNPTVDGDAAEDFDDAPTYLNEGEAVEVKVDDAAPMDESDEPSEPQGGVPPAEAQAPQRETPPDDSAASFATHADAVYAVDSHYDPATGTLYVASGGGDDRACLHAVSSAGSKSSVPLSHPHTDSVSCVAFNAAHVGNDASGTPQRSLLAAGSYDGSIVLYDPSTGQLVRAMEGPEDVEWLSFHPKGGTVLLAGSMADGTVWMYHLPTESCLQVFVGHEGGAVAGGFTPDGKTVVSAGSDGTVRSWAPRKGTCKHVFRLVGRGGGGGGGEMQPGLTCLALGGGQDGQLAAAGGEDGNAYVVHVGGKKVVATLPHFEGGKQQRQNNDSMEDEDMDDEGEARSVEAVGFCPAAVPARRVVRHGRVRRSPQGLEHVRGIRRRGPDEAAAEVARHPPPSHLLVLGRGRFGLGREGRSASDGVQRGQSGRGQRHGRLVRAGGRRRGGRHGERRPDREGVRAASLRYRGGGPEDELMLASVVLVTSILLCRVSIAEVCI